MTALKAAVFDKVYQSFFASTLSLYTDQYAGFGDARLMVLKATWDYAYYWSVLAWLYFRERMTDIAFLRASEAQLNAFREVYRRRSEAGDRDMAAALQAGAKDALSGRLTAARCEELTAMGRAALGVDPADEDPGEPPGMEVDSE